jgi:FMN hydrolase / 5-amino-6-(5-phospho-D-ribitylamino)uracil phosphatase
MMPGVVSFDLDETLWDFAPMMDGSLAATVEAVARRRPELAGVTVEELHRVRGEVGAECEGTYEALRLESFRRVLAARGVDDPELPRWMVDTWMAARVDSVEVHDDVEPALDELEARGYLLGAITNGNFPLDRLPLARRMAFVVHAEHAGGAKPGAEPFAMAMGLSGAHPSRWVHVGDSIESDVLGAQAFGLRAVWINRRGEPLPEGVTPEAELPSLQGLADVVDRLLGAA